MTEKRQIVSELGAGALLATEGIAASLIANDRVKYYLALLQTARTNAERPTMPPPTLRAEREACGIGDAWLDDVVGGARFAGEGAYGIPRAAEIVARIAAAVAAMLRCLPQKEQEEFRDRLARLPAPRAEGDQVTGAQIDAMTSGDRKRGDSIHLVVMDAHRAINTLQASSATEILAGAKVHALSKETRALVESFMAGLNRTAPLKFNHPGLGTTATEHNAQLLIQNDIGTTDAHVLVVRVRGLTASLNYTDIHRQRLDFFISLFARFDVTWERTTERDSTRLSEGHYLLTTGTFVATSEAELKAYLEFLGSRIVFLIDWNHMRKRLRAFIGKNRTQDVLKWAADHDHGHRALIEVGGETALAEAVEFALGKRLRYGQRLDELIGEGNAVAFLREAMKLSAVGLKQGLSRRIIRDQIRSALRGYVESERLGIFDRAATHAAIGFDTAFGVRESLERLATEEGRVWIDRFSRRAGVWEQRADDVLNEARADVKRFALSQTLVGFFEFADDAVDELEEAAALVALYALAASPPSCLEDVRGLADLALASAQEFVKCVECAATVSRLDVRDDLDDFLTVLGRLTEIEHAADERLRELRRRLYLGEEVPPRVLMMVRELTQALESTTDAYAHAGQALRAYLLDEVVQ